jgi:hypothetical protein
MYVFLFVDNEARPRYLQGTLEEINKQIETL